MSSAKAPVTPSTTASDAVVYVIQIPRPKPDGWLPNFETAKKYGRLEFVFSMNDRAWQDPMEAREKALSKLAGFNPEKDFILWPNFCDPSTLWLSIMLLVAKGHHKLKFLYWSRGRSADTITKDSGFYFPIDLDASGIRT